jgi:hypothetical protein
LIGITTVSPAYSGDNPPHHPAVDSSRRDESTQSVDAKSTNEFRLRAHSLGAIIGRYKSVRTKQIRRNGIPEFEWQSRFYDRIVHDADAFRAVRRYSRSAVHSGPSGRMIDGRPSHRSAVAPSDGSTTTVPVAVWPRVSGRYIISASAGGCSKVPAVVARAT